MRERIGLSAVQAADYQFWRTLMIRRIALAKFVAAIFSSGAVAAEY